MTEERVTIITAGLVEDDEDEDIFLSVEITGEQPVDWQMQRHEALTLIKVLAIALLMLEDED